MTAVAINGLGRIGRAALKIILDTPELKLAAINDLVPNENLAYLLKYDTVYGKYNKKVEFDEKNLIIDGQNYPVYHEKEPENLPWDDLGIDIVFECTGIFTDKEKMEKHIKAGAKRVILSAPAKGEGAETVVYGVNKPDGESKTISCASCTTNSITPAVEVMGRRIGIKKAIMTTIHAYTSTQSIVDGPAKKMRRGRAGAANLVPTSTGAAKATTKVLTEYKGKFDGIAVRVPVPVGSVSDVVFVTEKETSVEEIKSIFKEEALSDKYKGVIGVTEDEIVSADIIGDPHALIIDLSMTQVVDGDLVKILCWYDNEWGYASQMIREAVRSIA